MVAVDAQREAVPHRHRRAVARDVGIAGLAAAAGTGVVLLRQAGVAAATTIYAEDGTTFLADELRLPTLEAVTTPYAGYVNALPRAVAALVASLPLSAAAVAFALAAAAIAAGCAVAAHGAARSRLGDRRLAVGVGAAFVLLPLGGEEIWNATVNAHWLLLGLCFWMLAWRAPGRAQAVVAAAVLAATALTDPFVVLLLPVAAWRLWSDRSRRGRCVVAAAALGVVAQWTLTVLGSGEREGLEPTTDVVEVGLWFVRDVGAGLLVGERWLDALPDALLVLVGAAVLGGGALLGRAAAGVLDRSTGLLCLAGAASAVATYVVPVTLSGTHPARYSVPAALVLLGVLAIVVDALLRAGRLRWRQPLVVAVCAVAAFGWTTSLRLENQRSDGPSWAAGLAAAERACADAIDGGGSAAIPITPLGWSVEVPCRELG